MKQPSSEPDHLSAIEDDKFSHFLGIAVDTVRDGYALTRLTVRPELCNSFGSAHGGTIFSLADQALAVASNAGDRKSVAVSVTIDYMRPVEVGQTIVAEAKREQSKRVLSLYTIKIRTALDVPIAQAQALVYHLDT